MCEVVFSLCIEPIRSDDSGFETARRFGRENKQIAPAAQGKTAVRLADTQRTQDFKADFQGYHYPRILDLELQ